MTVSPFQPPPASIAARCQMPQVPLKGSGWPAQQRVACSMPRWASSVTICISVSAFSCGLRKSKRACTKAALRLGHWRRTAACSGAGNRSAARSRRRRWRSSRSGVFCIASCSAPPLKPLRSVRCRATTSKPLALSSAATVRASSAVSSVLSSRTWMCSLSRGQSSRAAASTPRRSTGPSLKDGICTTTCGSSRVRRQRRGQQRLLAAEALLLQAVMQHAPCRAGCRRRRRAAGSRRRRSRRTAGPGWRGWPSADQVPVLGVRLNSVLRPKPAPTMAPALAAAR